jgi:hypothetical protein
MGVATSSGAWPPTTAAMPSLPTVLCNRVRASSRDSSGPRDSSGSTSTPPERLARAGSSGVCSVAGSRSLRRPIRPSLSIPPIVLHGRHRY